MTDSGSVAFGGAGIYVDKRPAQFGMVNLEKRSSFIIPCAFFV